jgi:N-acetylmuramoyl-L-alanine amidase
MPHLLWLWLTAWPSTHPPLERVALPAQATARKLKVYVDAGHGAKDNHGAVSCTCENEEDFTLRTASALAAALGATGRFEVKLSRSGDERPSYLTRTVEAEKWKADLLLGIHFDVRGVAYPWEPEKGKQCWRAPLLVDDETDAVGFALLWSDEEAATHPERSRSADFGRAIALRMAEAGMRPYRGYDYQGLYVADDAAPGGFIDRHRPRQRVWMLRKPRVPSIIIETHHALDLEERARWDEPATLEAFGAAVAAGLLDAQTPVR